jgi:hypothetical protein
MHEAHLFVLLSDLLAGLVLVAAAAAAVVATKFSQCNMLPESFPHSRVQGVKGLILVGALFPLNGGRREGNKKEKRKG